MRLLLRMTQWVRHPPSQRQLITVGVVLAFALAIYAVEKGLGWPEWLTVDRPGPRPGVPR